MPRFVAGHRARARPGGPPPGTPVGPAVNAVLLINPRSGGETARRVGLAQECRARGIEPVVLQPGEQLVARAEAAVAGGADVIGMAGGDGSLALVAAVAARHQVPMVVVPAGTRNHLAMDLGLDRADVLGALDAYGAAVERAVDLGTSTGGRSSFVVEPNLPATAFNPQIAARPFLRRVRRWAVWRAPAG